MVEISNLLAKRFNKYREEHLHEITNGSETAMSKKELTAIAIDEFLKREGY